MRIRPPLAALAVVALVLLPGAASSQFSGSTQNPGNSAAAAATFPTHPQSVAAMSPWAYWRGEDTPSGSAGSTAADSSGNSRPGTYDAPTDGATTWWSFDDATTTTVPDDSQAGNTGSVVSTIVPSIDATDSHRGSSFDLRGAKARVEGPVTGAVSPRGNFTLSVWAQLDGLPADTTVQRNNTVLSLVGANESAVALVWSNADDVDDSTKHGTACQCWTMRLTRSDVVNPSVMTLKDPAAVTSATVDDWTHLAVVHSGTSWTFYVNGVSQGSVTLATSWGSRGTLVAGQRLQKPTFFGDSWFGRLDEVKAYPRALSAAGVTNLFVDGTTALYDAEETSGDLVDGSGHALGGTLAAGATRTASGRSGRGLSFDGSSGYATAPGSALDASRPFTVAGWVYATGPATTATPTEQVVLSKPGTVTSPFRLAYRTTSSGASWVFRMDDADRASPGSVTSSASAGGSTASGRWVHLVGVWDGSTATLYVNGSSAGGVPVSTSWNPSGPLRAGAAGTATTPADFLSGRLDGLRTYQRAVGPAEALALSATTFPAARPQDPLDATSTAGVVGALQGGDQGLQATTGTAFSGLATGGAHGPATTTPASFSVESWVRTSAPGGGCVVVFDTTATGRAGTASRALFVDSGGSAAFAVRGADGSTTSLRSAVPVTDGSWHHLAATYDASSRVLSLYRDGLLDASTTATVAASPAASGFWRWGAGPDAQPWPAPPSSPTLTGALDETAVHTRALTAVEVAHHYFADF